MIIQPLAHLDCILSALIRPHCRHASPSIAATCTGSASSAPFSLSGVVHCSWFLRTCRSRSPAILSITTFCTTMAALLALLHVPLLYRASSFAFPSVSLLSPFRVVSTRPHHIHIHQLLSLTPEITNFQPRTFTFCHSTQQHSNGTATPPVTPPERPTMLPGTVDEALHQGALPLLPAVNVSDLALLCALATMKTAATGMSRPF